MHGFRWLFSGDQLRSATDVRGCQVESVHGPPVHAFQPLRARPRRFARTRAPTWHHGRICHRRRSPLVVCENWLWAPLRGRGMNWQQTYARNSPEFLRHVPDPRPLAPAIRTPASRNVQSGTPYRAPRRSATSRSISRLLRGFRPDAAIRSLIFRKSRPSLETVGLGGRPFRFTNELSLLRAMTQL